MKKAVLLILSAAVIFTMTACQNKKKDNTQSSPSDITISTFDSGYVSPSQSDDSQATLPSYLTVSEETYMPPPVTTTALEESAEDTAFSEEDSPEEPYRITDFEALMYANSSVNIREKPDADSKRISHLNKGDEAHITGIVSNGWYRIIIKGNEYFVNGRYLSDYIEPDYEETTTAKTSKPETTVSETEPNEDDIQIEEPDSEDPDVQIDDTVGTDEPTVSEIDDNPIVEEFTLPQGFSNYSALNFSTQKAMWFAYLDIDTMLANATESDFRAQIMSAFLNAKLIGCNTVYVHVRAFSDAYYFSDLYPFAASYSGTAGVRPDYDPLRIMIDEAHNLGLSFHAWINPMRTTTKKRFAEISDNYAIKQWYNSDTTNGTYLVYDSDTGYYWLSPAYSAVRELICNGVAEIITRYNVDGIHIDDYFYPTTDKSFDKLAFQTSGRSDLSQWRRDTVSLLVSDIYTTVKSCNPSVEFGVSPQGNLDNNVNKLYADVEKWCSKPGYLDYITPQIYYGYNDKLPFDSTAETWQSLIRLPNVKLICGIAAYKVGINAEWSTGDMLARQTDYIDSLPGYSGCAYYRYSSLFTEGTDVSALMISERNQLREAIANLD